jgi:hypothetical protein
MVGGWNWMESDIIPAPYHTSGVSTISNTNITGVQISEFRAPVAAYNEL